MMEFYNRDNLLAWAAGLFDGEGTIYSNKGKVRVSIHMTDLDILETFKSNFGGSIYPQKKQKVHHKKSWRWSLQSAKEAIKFLEDILPYLHYRRTIRTKEAIISFAEATKIKQSKQEKIK